MSKSIPISKKPIDFQNNDSIKLITNFQQKKILNNQKYSKHIPKEPSLPLNSKINTQLLEKYFGEKNYANNLFNETDNSQNFHEENGAPNLTYNNLADSKDNNNNNILINQQINNNEKFVTINDIIGEKCEINLDILRLFYNSFEPSKTSRKNMGVIKSYGVNTYQGIVRNYNEDRVSIIINMNKPKDFIKGKWPKISFFGIYDGHGGEGCSEYLRDNLHKLICNNENFPENIPEAIKLGISSAEKDFLNNYALSEDKEEIIDKSGSCAIIILIVDTNVYIANVGDSRCLLSMNDGEKYLEVTKDHKPNSPKEIIRIKKNGGDIYQSQTIINNTENMELNGKILIGPYRVLPGRLSVSRTIGDAEAKLIKFGGNPNVIICEPEIFFYDLKKENFDFFILGCDGIYDQMSNKEILDCAWMVLNEKDNLLVKECKNIHNKSGLIVDLILKSSLARKSFDNVTCLFIALKDLGIEQNENNNEQMLGANSDNGITPHKIIPISSPKLASNEQNNKSNFEKIYTIKRKSNIISKQVLNELNIEEAKCKTNRNDNRFQLLINNRLIDNKNAFNTDFKMTSLKLNSEAENNKKEINYYNKQNLSMKDFNTVKNKENYKKIQNVQQNLKENDENTNKKFYHNKIPSSIAYSKKNQSFTKINKYLISLNNNNGNNGNNNNFKQIKKINNNLMNNFTAISTKKISEGNIINRKKIEINSKDNNGNNSHIFKPISKFNFNNQQPLKIIESKNSFTNSTKNLSLTNKNSLLLNNVNNYNKNPTQHINHASTKSHRYLISSKDNRNSSYLQYNNNSNFNINNNKINIPQNQNSINDKIKQNFINLNENYRHQSQLMNNSLNNNNLSAFSNKIINQRRPKKHLSLNSPGSGSMLSTNNFMINKNTNNVFSSRLKRDITSKIRQISMQKSLPINNLRLNHQINGADSKHNISMQSIQLTNNFNHLNNIYGDKIQKINTYKYNNNDKIYQNYTFNSTHKNNNYSFGKYSNNSYLMTDLGRTKKEFLLEDNKKNKIF